MIQCFASSLTFIDYIVKSKKSHLFTGSHRVHAIFTGIDRQCGSTSSESDKHKHHTPPSLKLASKEAIHSSLEKADRECTNNSLELRVLWFTLSLETHTEFLSFNNPALNIISLIINNLYTWTFSVFPSLINKITSVPYSIINRTRKPAEKISWCSQVLFVC